jgi:hypothetical protein
MPSLKVNALIPLLVILFAVFGVVSVMATQNAPSELTVAQGYVPLLATTFQPHGLSQPQSALFYGASSGGLSQAVKAPAYVVVASGEAVQTASTPMLVAGYTAGNLDANIRCKQATNGYGHLLIVTASPPAFRHTDAANSAVPAKESLVSPLGGRLTDSTARNHNSMTATIAPAGSLYSQPANAIGAANTSADRVVAFAATPPSASTRR